MSRILCIGAWIALLAAVAVAGGPGPHERRLALGRCGTAACVWDCDTSAAVCGDPQQSCALPAATFAARLRLAVDDQQCSGNGGGRLTIGLAGRRTDGVGFALSDTTLDFCGVLQESFECGAPTGECENPEPRTRVFLCTTVLPNGLLDEDGVPNAEWLTYSSFPPAVAQALRDALGVTAGEPIVLGADEVAFDNQIGTSEPTTRELCITGAVVTPAEPLGVPAAVLALGTSTSASTVTFGDCPTLPTTSTTSTTSSQSTTTTTTTVPGNGCATAPPADRIRCLVDGGAAACDAVPKVVTKKRDAAVRLVERALDAAPPKARERRLAKAARLLDRAGRKVEKRRDLAPACRDALIAALDAARSVVEALRTS